MNQINKYVWLVDTIHRAGRISLKEINRRWVADEISEGVEIPERTFHKWRIAVEELFGLIIENEQRGDYRYFILNDEELSRGGLRTWLFNSISTSNLLSNNQSLNNRILLEDVPSGRQYLSVILDTMKHDNKLQITYQSFWRSEAKEYELEPYCVKLFRQRWYLVAKNNTIDKISIFSLDRIANIKKLPATFEMPKDFSAEDFFKECFGVIANDGTGVEHVLLKVNGNQPKYFRSLPLHSSQTETQTEKDYSIFAYDLRPTYDFQQEILSHIPFVEVLAPDWLRKEMAGKISKMYKKYKSE